VYLTKLTALEREEHISREILPARTKRAGVTHHQTIKHHAVRVYLTYPLTVAYSRRGAITPRREFFDAYIYL